MSRTHGPISLRVQRPAETRETLAQQCGRQEKTLKSCPLMSTHAETERKKECESNFLEIIEGFTSFT